MPKGKPKLEEVIEYVENNALYNSDHKFDPYFVRYAGRPFIDKSIRDLVLQIMDQCHPNCSTRGY